MGMMNSCLNLVICKAFSGDTMAYSTIQNKTKSTGAVRNKGSFVNMLRKSIIL